MTTSQSAAPGQPEPSPFHPDPARPRSRVLALAAFAVVLTGAALLTWRLAAPRAAGSGQGGHAHGAAPAADSARPVMLSAEAAWRIGVTFAPVTFGPLNREVRTVAIVRYDETRLHSVTARVDGWIERLFVNFTGQAVRTGEPLYSIYSPMLVSAQQELLLASRLRREVAGGTGDAVSGTDDLLQAARRRLLYWEVPADEVRAIEERGEISKALTFRSPTSGVVLEKLVLAGQRVMAGEPVYRIADLKTVWLEGEIFERDLPAVRLGLPVTAEFAALPGAIRSGRITYVYPTLNPETRTARVRVELANPDLALKPGMYSTFRFTSATAPVASVPRSAVLVTGERNLVFVRMPDGMLMPHYVTLGTATDDRIEILSGVEVGDTVVRSATFLVDAESNLGSLLGGMGDMPGMDIKAPDTTAGRPGLDPGAGAPTPAASTPRSAPRADSSQPHPRSGHEGHGSGSRPAREEPDPLSARPPAPGE